MTELVLPETRFQANRIGIGVVGYGYWGPNLARNFARLPGTRIAVIVEPDRHRQVAAKLEHPEALVFANAEEALTAPELDAVVIAAPPPTHYELARAALRAGKHVLIEKPFTTGLAPASDIVAEAQRANRILLVDYTFLYAPAVEILISIVQGGDIGEPIYVECTRTNLAHFDPSIGVIRDLAIHDLAILDALFGCEPTIMSACRRPSYESKPEDFSFIRLDYGGVAVHLHANCIGPVKIRRMTIGGTRGLVVYDDVEPVEKLRIFQHGRGASMTELRTGYRDGPVHSPKILPDEPLARVATHFMDCMQQGAVPRTDGRSALRILAAIEAVERLLARQSGPAFTS
jgi:predicted dehydrogenase